MTIDWSQLKTAEQKLEEEFNQAFVSKNKENNNKYSEVTLSVTKDYPQMEKDTWPTQEKEVKVWRDDPENALTPWIDLAASVRGLPREEYLQRTLNKTIQFEQISAYLTGLRQKYEDQIKSCETIEDLDSIVIEYPLPDSFDV